MLRRVKKVPKLSKTEELQLCSWLLRVKDGGSVCGLGQKSGGKSSCEKKKL